MTQTLPLTAWCLGQHLFQHPEFAPVKLAYKVALQRIKVTWGQSPPENLEFKLDRDVCSAMVTCFVSLLHLLNDDDPC